MKFVRIFCLILALLMVGGAVVACGGGTDTEPETDADTDETEGDREPITVHIIVRAEEKGENVYESDPSGYKFEGDTLTVTAILEEFMDFEQGIVIEYDENGKVKKVGDLEASDSQLWLFSIAKPPRTAEQAEPVDANMNEYSEIEDGDIIVIYLS